MAVRKATIEPHIIAIKPFAFCFSLLDFAPKIIASIATGKAINDKGNEGIIAINSNSNIEVIAKKRAVCLYLSTDPSFGVLIPFFNLFMNRMNLILSSTLSFLTGLEEVSSEILLVGTGCK